MDIIDITNLLIGDKSNISNYYCFNNSLINIRDNLFLMTYRVIYYKLDIKIHPWGIWWDGYNIFCSRCPDVSKNTVTIGQSKQFNAAKYRKKLNGDILHNFSNQFYDEINYDLLEFDGTGIALIEINNGEVKVLNNINNIFNDEMNQDARLVKSGDDIYVTYNAYMVNNNNITVPMLQRKIYMSDNLLYLGDESYMSLVANRPIEKNWIIFDGNITNGELDILYSINGSFEVISGKSMKICEIPVIRNLIEKYKHIYFSLSTPCLKHSSSENSLNKYISVGHLKIDYRFDYTNTAFGDFLKEINFFENVKIKKHGRFIYFMFFFIFDNNYKMTHISDAFIPKKNDEYLPYLLVFPSGFEKMNEEYIVSYGEGDERSKLLFLSSNEVNNMLVPLENNDNYDMKFELFEKKRNVLIIGYYGEFNTGDECYKHAFNKIFKDSCITFINPHKIKTITKKYDIIICGGGNLLNEYFINQIRKIINVKTKIIAFSVDIPYTSIINDKFLDFFDEIYVRNYTDSCVLRNNNYNNVISMPDAVFVLDRPLIKLNREYIGFCLTRTIYNKKFEREYFNLVIKFSKIIKKLMTNHKICLIPFCINQNNNKENDNILNNQLKKITSCYSINDFINIDTNDYPMQLFNFFGNLKHVVCMRYHAHIFSIIHGIPFTSLATTRKCKLLLTENELLDCHYEMKINNICFNPVDMDENGCYNKIINNIENKKNITEKFDKIYNKNKIDLNALIF